MVSSRSSHHKAVCRQRDSLFVGLAWWNLACLEGTVPLDRVVAGSTSNAFGFNAGAGLSRRIGNSPALWYVEIRYHDAPYHGVSTQAVPLIIGLAGSYRMSSDQ